MPKGYFIYSDNEDATSRTFYGKAIDPHKSYIRHYGHFLELSFICRNTTGLDHFQAEKELVKCEEKLARAFKRKDFMLSVVMGEIQRLKKDWNAIDIPDRWSR